MAALAALEAHSEHPIGKAIAGYVPAAGLRVEDV